MRATLICWLWKHTRSAETKDVYPRVCQRNGYRCAISTNLEPEHLDVEIRDSWYHITNSGGYHDSHFHGGCSWCGIYYLQIGSAGTRTGRGAPNGGNRFYSPVASGGKYEDLGNRYLGSTSIDPPISDGMLLLFSIVSYCIVDCLMMASRTELSFPSIPEPFRCSKAIHEFAFVPTSRRVARPHSQ